MAGLFLLTFSLSLAAALLSYRPDDPSLNSATDLVPQNMLGLPGAWFADFALQGFGFASALLVPIFAVWGLRLIFAQPVVRRRKGLVFTFFAMLFAAVALGLAWPAPVGLLDSGSGGVVGLAAAKGAAAIGWPAGFDPALGALLLAITAGLSALALFVLGLGPRRAEFAAFGGMFRKKPRADDDFEGAPYVAPAARSPRPNPPAPADIDAPSRRISGPIASPAPRRAAPDRQPTLQLGDRADLPSLSLLKPPPRTIGQTVDPAALEQNARLLESVLDDFGVKGRIVGLAQGPVVTLYELEPAPGIKASRVIGLADDIARSMSAVSARVAVIPGRNVIGIELPNLRREMVSLSELVAADAFQASSGTLPIILGKDISGGPVIVDLAPMPHLLIAGTTGSGKSVGLNAMILSLLYRLRPDQCRMIIFPQKS